MVEEFTHGYMQLRFGGQAARARHLSELLDTIERSL
jgi:hypothetical protein